ncbi:MAG: PQQ-binding-like beta-propeller repeat protein [Planctomycetota bacterium JB042]
MTRRRTIAPLAALLAVSFAPASAADDDFDDPAPPAVEALPAIDPPAAEAFDGRTVHRAPRPLVEGAVVEEWPGFLGPRRDGICRETPLAERWGSEGPPKLWEAERGEGYASPAVADGRVVLCHRVDGDTHVDCHDLTTGRRFWRHSFPTTFRDDYIKNGGPRATPAIADGVVFVHGIEGRLIALELATGRVVWERHPTKEFGVPDLFFGVVASPLIRGDTVVVNLGASGGPCVAAFDRASGRLVWGAGDAWGASCASPVVGRFGGRERLLVLTGGKTRPPTGGLMVLDPDSGAVDFSFPFRSRTYASVNGASPVAIGGGVLLTASYGTGTVLLDPGPANGGDAPVERWRKRRWGIQFGTPVAVDGALWVVDGAPTRAGAIVRLDPATGEETARLDVDVPRRFGERSVDTSVGEGALLALGDDRLLCLGDTGLLLLLALDEDGPRVVASHADWSNTDTWTPPAISSGVLLLAQNSPCRFTGAPARWIAYDLRAGG